MMFCPNCGKQIPDGSAFCENCGARLGATQAPQPPIQQEYRQSQYQQPQAVQQQPKKNKKILKIAIICVAVVLVFALVRALLGDWLDDGEPVEYRPNQITDVTVTPSGGTQSGGSLLDMGSSPSNSTASGEQTAASYSTDALPHEADFAWYYDDQLVSGVPSDAVTISDPALLTGGWMATWFRNPIGAWQKEFVNIDIVPDGAGVKVTQRWSELVGNDGSVTDASGGNPTEYSGSFNGEGWLDVTDDYGNHLVIVRFYEWNGKQYGIGSYDAAADHGAGGFAVVFRP